jgi:hypothetical protein
LNFCLTYANEIIGPDSGLELLWEMVLVLVVLLDTRRLIMIKELEFPSGFFSQHVFRVKAGIYSDDKNLNFISSELLR